MRGKQPLSESSAICACVQKQTLKFFFIYTKNKKKRNAREDGTRTIHQNHQNNPHCWVLKLQLLGEYVIISVI